MPLNPPVTCALKQLSPSTDFSRVCRAGVSKLSLPRRLSLQGPVPDPQAALTRCEKCKNELEVTLSLIL